MTGSRPAEILRCLEPPGSDDRALLTRYAGHNDQTAFAELVRRHGPMVWAACLRVAGHQQDAEDAFQAVFLVLVRKCGAIRNLDLLGNWLYGVAVRVAMRARRAAARRRAREVQVPAMPEPPGRAVEAAPDLAPVLDEELAALPAWYREAVVLCDLRGVSREEASRLLGVPEGTLSSRLATGRKKLAARLARRGVALSAAVLPSVLEGAARAAVPAELMASVCATVGGGAVPAPVARLAGGELSMTTKVLTGVAGAALLAVGAVFATQSATPPKPGDPPRPAVAAKPDPAAEQQPGAEMKGGEKVAYATHPRMRVARDFTLGNVQAVAWSPDGKVLAIEGYVKQSGGIHVVELTNIDPKSDPIELTYAIEPSSHLVGVTDGAKELVLDQRERGLVSGFHRLRYLIVNPKAKAVSVGEAQGRTVDLDAGDTHGYAFAADGKTFRTLASTTGTGGALKKISVTSVDAANGATIRTLLTAEGEFQGYGLSPGGERLGVVTAAGTVDVYDVETGKRMWTKENMVPQRPDPVTPNRKLSVAFSPDAKRMVVSGQRVRPLVLDAPTGERSPQLENAEPADAFPSPACFSRDGRLVVLHGQQYTVSTTRGGQEVWSRAGEFLCVWNTDTGKLLKQWNQAPTAVAFHPAKPLLAVVESNGENKSRVGLWDFAADPPKK